MDTLAPLDLDAAQELWTAYLQRHMHAVRDEDPPAVERFGDNAELAEELLALVLSGTKTATSTLVAEFHAEGAPLPRIGSHWIACDAAGRPRAVLRTVELRLGAIDSVDAAFAHDEARTTAAGRAG